MRRSLAIAALLLAPLLLQPPAGALHEGMPREVGAAQLEGPGWTALKVSSTVGAGQLSQIWVVLHPEGAEGFVGAGVAVLDAQGRMRASGFGWTFAYAGEELRASVKGAGLLDAPAPLPGVSQAYGFACTGCLHGARHVVLYSAGSFDRMRVSVHAEGLASLAQANGTGTFDLAGPDAEAKRPGLSLAAGARGVLVRERAVGAVNWVGHETAAAMLVRPDGVQRCPCWLGDAADGPGAYVLAHGGVDGDAANSLVFAGADVRLPS